MRTIDRRTIIKTGAALAATALTGGCVSAQSSASASGGLAKSLPADEVFAKFKSQLEIRRISLQLFFRFFDQYSGSLFLCGLKLFRFLRVDRVFFLMAGQKFLVCGDVAFRPAHF